MRLRQTGTPSRRHSRTALLALGLAVATGCSANEMKLIPMVWPEPPQTPRIEFVTAVASDADLAGDFELGQVLSVGLIGTEDERIWHLYQPVAVAASDDGQRVYVGDYVQALLYVFDFANRRVRVVGEEGGFVHPIGVAVDGSGQVYVADQKGKNIAVLSPDGDPQRAIHLDNIERPGGIAIDRERSRLYVVDSGGPQSKDHHIRVYDLNGTYLRSIGEGRGSGPGQLDFPTYVAVGPDGAVYVSDTMNARVAVFDADGRFLRNVGRRGDRFGEFDKPKGVALDTFGNLYVADSSWSNVQIFNARGDVLLFFGGRSRYPGMLQNPTGLTINRQNEIFVCDTFNHRLSVYRLVNTTAEDSLITLTPADSKGGGAGT